MQTRRKRRRKTRRRRRRRTSKRLVFLYASVSLPHSSTVSLQSAPSPSLPTFTTARSSNPLFRSPCSSPSLPPNLLNGIESTAGAPLFPAQSPKSCTDAQKRLRGSQHVLEFTRSGCPIRPAEKRKRGGGAGYERRDALSCRVRPPRISAYRQRMRPSESTKKRWPSTRFSMPSASAKCCERE